MLAANFHLFQLAQGAQAEVEDGFGLNIRNAEAGDHHLFRLVFLADDADHFINIEIGDQIAVEQVEALLDLVEAELGAAHHHFAAMLQIGLQHILQAHDLWRALVQHVHVHAEARFQVARLEQAFHQHVRLDRLGARHQNKAHILSALVAHIVEQRQLLLFQQLAQFLEQARLLHLIRNLRHDDLVSAAARVFDFPLGAHAETAAARLVSIQHGFLRLNDHAASRKVRPLHEAHQLFGRRFRRLNQEARRVDHFSRIVRRNAGRHAHGNARCAIAQQVRKARRQHDRLFVILGIVGPEIDRVLVEAFQQQLGRMGHPRFGVTIGSRAIPVDITKVALAIDQRVANVEILRQAHKRVIDRTVTMRVPVTHHVADDLGALAEAAFGVQPQFAHAVQDAALDRLQPVAHIRQGSGSDGRKRIGEIALRQRLAHGFVYDPVFRAVI